MTDVTNAGGGDGGTGGDQGGAAGAAAIAATGASGSGSDASWRDTLPDALKADPSLANFADVAALAEGYRSTKAALTARAPDMSSEAGLKMFADAVRPGDAKQYDIPVPDGQPSALADGFRAFAHAQGMPPAWAKATAEFFNQQTADALAAAETASAKEVDTLKGEIGQAKFGQKLEGVRRDLQAAGVQLGDDELAKLDSAIGSANLLKYMFWVNDRVGDPAPIEGASGAGATTIAMTPDQAKAKWDEVSKSKDWRQAAKVEGSPEQKEYQRLQSLIAAGRAQPKKPG